MKDQTEGLLDSPGALGDSFSPSLLSKFLQISVTKSFAGSRPHESRRLIATGQALGWQMRLRGNTLLRRGFGMLGLIEFLPEAIDFFRQFLRLLGLIIQPFTQFLDILLRRSRFA